MAQRIRELEALLLAKDPMTARILRTDPTTRPALPHAPPTANEQWDEVLGMITNPPAEAKSP